MNIETVTNFAQENDLSELLFVDQDPGLYEGWVIKSNSDNSWVVYYSDNGTRDHQKYFKFEANACEYVLKMLEEETKYG